jgi:hypothetical protein
MKIGNSIRRAMPKWWDLFGANECLRGFLPRPQWRIATVARDHGDRQPITCAPQIVVK